jgi:hypothetical protein
MLVVLVKLGLKYIFLLLTGRQAIAHNAFVICLQRIAEAV